MSSSKLEEILLRKNIQSLIAKAIDAVVESQGLATGDLYDVYFYITTEKDSNGITLGVNINAIDFRNEKRRGHC